MNGSNQAIDMQIADAEVKSLFRESRDEIHAGGRDNAAFQTLTFTYFHPCCCDHRYRCKSSQPKYSAGSLMGLAPGGKGQNTSWKFEPKRIHFRNHRGGSSELLQKPVWWRVHVAANFMSSSKTNRNQPGSRRRLMLRAATSRFHHSGEKAASEQSDTWNIQLMNFAILRVFAHRWWQLLITTANRLGSLLLLSTYCCNFYIKSNRY